MFSSTDMYRIQVLFLFYLNPNLSKKTPKKPTNQTNKQKNTPQCKQENVLVIPLCKK